MSHEESPWWVCNGKPSLLGRAGRKHTAPGPLRTCSTAGRRAPGEPESAPRTLGPGPEGLGLSPGAPGQELGGSSSNAKQSTEPRS